MTDAGMTAATWTFVEALGIPDSAMRRVLFDLAAFVEASPEGDQYALATSAYLALTKEFQEQFTPKSPLRQQAEYLKMQRELEELMGVRPPDIPGEEFELRPTPETTVQLAAELNYQDEGRAVRQVLRKGFPDHPKNAPWEPLTEKQVNYVRAHLSKHP